jgi:diguanylate cyclase (GGDEF)-like protein
MKESVKNKQNDENKMKSFIPGLSRPGMWVFIYLFFAVLPLLIFHQSYKVYLENEFQESREKTIKYYYRELVALKRKATNQQIFLKLLQSFRDSFRRNLPQTPSLNPALIEGLFDEIPGNSTLISWDESENIIASYTRLSKAGQNVSEEKIRQFISLLLDAYYDFNTGANLQTLHQARLFEVQNRPFFYELRPLLGQNFPVHDAFTSRDLVTGEFLDVSDVYFYWDFYNNRDKSQGGFLVIIPKSSLAATFAISGVLKRDPSANPDYSCGLFDVTSGEVEVSYAGLQEVAEKMVSGYRSGATNPFFNDDWVLFVQPIQESSSANIFSLFSVKHLRTGFENAVNSSQLLIVILAIAIGILFVHFYRVAKIKGLSLKKKLTWLFLFCMQLPISILIFLGIQFSLSKERLLSIEAESSLVQMVKKIDYSSQEHYRSLTEWLKKLRNSPELKEIQRDKLSQKFFEFSDSNQLKSFYLTGINGEILFDIENLEKDDSNRTFIKELGIKILANHSGSLPDFVEMPDESVGSFMDAVIKRTGVLHQLNWPGSNEKRFVFSDVVQNDEGRLMAIIAAFDKTAVDRNYLRNVISEEYRRTNNHEIFILNKNDISETVPRLDPTFKANLLPILTTSRLSNTIETDKINDARSSYLVALSEGIFTQDFIIGARASWGKIVESIRKMYFLVILGLLFSLASSIVLIMVLLREFLTPVFILSSGAKAIIGGDLDLNLPVFSKDELGDLSETFNFMTRRLKNRLTELTVLYNMTQKASTSHNQREVFDLAAERLKTHLNAETQGTAWINEGEGAESVYLAEHYSHEIDESIRKIVIISMRNFKTHLEYSAAINKHVLSIPLFFEEKRFGSIYLTFEKERFSEHVRLTEDEKSFIETLRHHLSLIIEKQRLFEQAITDGLTKLYVRRFFLATLEKELARSKRYQLDVSIVLLDIDHFKLFNDKHGHQAGDYVLRETAQRIVECIRSVDTPGRYGGEEMAVLLPQTNIKEAYLVADRIKKTIESAEYTFRNKSMNVTVSAGVSALHGRQVTVEELIEEADKALYVAKDKGRNQVRIAPEAM